MTKYTNDTLCHVWASGNKASGESNNGSLYFEGPALFSYGAHYCVGFLMPDNVVLLNSSKSSRTTQKHCSYARRAVSHMVRHSVPELEDIRGALYAIHAGNIEQHQRDSIARHAAKHALGMEQSAIAYLLRLAGKRQADRAAKAAIAKATRDAKAAKQQADRLAMDRAREYASMTQDDIARALAFHSEQWNPINALKVAASGARIAHKAAKARGWSAIAAKIWAYIKALDDKRHWFERNAANIEKRKMLRRYGNRGTVRRFR